MEFNGSDGQLLKANVISSGALLLALGTSVIQASQFVNVDFQVPFAFLTGFLCLRTQALTEKTSQRIM